MPMTERGVSAIALSAIVIVFVGLFVIKETDSEEVVARPVVHAAQAASAKLLALDKHLPAIEFPSAGTIRARIAGSIRRFTFFHFHRGKSKTA